MEERMRKVIDYELTYCKDGVELKKIIPIKFISNGVHDKYIAIAQKANETIILTQKKTQLINDLASCIITKKKTIPEKWKGVKELRAELKQTEEDLNALDGKAFLTDRFDLVKKIFTDNGIEDPELFDFNFWQECTEPTDIWEFLAGVVMKDYDMGQKKKNQ